MKKILYFLLFVPFVLSAQNNSADALAFIESAVAAIKADAAVQMNYSYKVYDEEKTLLQADNGVMKLDGNRYALLMNDMKVWCNGVAQWSYMADINEIYITDAGSAEAQNFSPLAIMEMYTQGYNLSMELQGGVVSVVLEAASAEPEVASVELLFNRSNNRLTTMFISLRGMGHIAVELTNYLAKCNFPASDYECPLSSFPAAEVVDMR